MKILHINNIANVAVQLRDAQRSLGHQVIVATTKEDPTILNFPEDLRFNPSISRAAFAVQLFSLIRWADVVHLHSFVWPSLVRLMNPIRKFLRRPTVAHYHGSDVRSGDWKTSSRLADAIVLSTPDLKRWCPSGTYIPDPITLPKFLAHPSSQKFRVVHAHIESADLEGVKGTETIREVVGRIPAAELVEVCNTPHDEALRIYATCHLAIDQLRIGWYGMFALECAAMGIPVLGYVDKSIDEKNWVYPVDDSNLEGTILDFMEDRSLCSSVMKEQRSYASRHHNANRIAHRFLNIYSRLLGDRQDELGS